MSTEPRTPDMDDMRAAWVEYSDSFALARPVAEFERFIAKIKADALREAAESTGIKDNIMWLELWLNDRADRVEKGDQ